MDSLLLVALFFKWAIRAALTDDKDASFKSFCANPPNFGVGDYDDENQKCHITYNVKSADDEYAQGFCDKQHPFALVKAEAKGDLTVCHLAVYYKCSMSEFLIGDRCYIAQKKVQYDAAASTCTDLGTAGMSMHKISSFFEQKWIAAFFTSNKMMWIGNTKNDLRNLKVASFEGMVLSSMEDHPVSETPEQFVIITSKGSLTSVRGGTITAMSKTTHLPVLCSRSADTNTEYDAAFTDMLREAGIVSHFYKGHNGRYRPFIIMRVLVGFEMNEEFAAGGKLLHYACKSLKNGYAATPVDFENVGDFKDMLKKEKVNIVGVPGSRSTDITMRNLVCVKDSRYQYFRRHFFFELRNGALKSANDEKYWRPTFPDRYCADTPRVALGFSQEGLVDLPSVARMFVACTFGQEVAVAEDERRGLSCSIHASYDKKTDTCTCIPPFTDLKDTKMLYKTGDEDYKSGHFCLNCDRAHDHEIAIVIENNRKSSGIRNAILRLLRLFAYMGYVSRSRMKLYTFDSTYREGKYRIPSLPLDSIRRHFESDFPTPRRDGARLAPVLNAVYNFFKAKPTNRKLVVQLLSSVPSDLADAKAVMKKIIDSNMAAEAFIFNDKKARGSLRELTSRGKAIFVRADRISAVVSVSSRVQQAMLRNACLAD